VGRNLRLGRAGTRTVYYIDSWNYWDLYATPTGLPYRHWLWGYLFYDVLVSWNGTIVDYFRAHRQEVGRYVSVGCLWAEHTRLLRDGAIRSEARDRLLARLAPGQRVVAVFPAWYQENSMDPPEDGLAFVEDVRRLLDEFPDIVLVVKEKQPRWFFVRHPRRQVRRRCGGRVGAQIYAAYDALEREPRCILPGHAMSPSELIVVSDVVISFAFTSTTYEALASGVKALFHDPNGRQQGAFYDRIPGLVTHDYASLARRVRQLLDETPSAEYVDYLEKHFVGPLEPDLQGRALSRFRALLTAERS
jgi:polysaccharide biosynthesis PFTS motif protein